MIEGRHFDVGGIVHFGDAVRLRHLASGLVLAIAAHGGSGDSSSGGDADGSDGSFSAEEEGDWGPEHEQALLEAARLGLHGCVLLKASSPAALARSLLVIMPADGAMSRTGQPITRIRTHVRFGWRGDGADEATRMAGGGSSSHEPPLWMGAGQPRDRDRGRDSAHGGGTCTVATVPTASSTLHALSDGTRARSPGLGLTWGGAEGLPISDFALAAVPNTELYEIDRVLSWKSTAAEWASPVTLQAAFVTRRAGTPSGTPSPAVRKRRL